MKPSSLLKPVTGLLAGVFAAVAGAAGVPCPPPSLSIQGGSPASASCTGGTAETDWIARSTAPGVIWAHDFRNPEELNLFVRNDNTTNPTPGSLPNGLSLSNTPFGNSRALVSRAIGSTITVATPQGQPYDVQVWRVANASTFPDPAGFPYELLVGKPNAGDETSSGGLEWVELQSRDVVNNTITVKRQMNNNVVKVEGVNYSRSLGVAPSFPAGYTVGRGPQGSWNRPFAAFPAGQNGRTSADVGIANGVVTKPRSWSTARNTTAHASFREGYFGHKSYWDPAAGAALYRNWTPADLVNSTPRLDAWDGDEIWIQFRARISASRFQAPAAKMLFIQHAATSGTGQFFWIVGGKQYDEVRPAGEEAGQTGRLIVPLTAYADSAAPAGGILAAGGQTDSMDTGTSPLQNGYPTCYYDNRSAAGGTGMKCWTFPADKWVTYLVHFKFGRDNAPVNPVPAGGGFNSGASTLGLKGPWPAASDQNYRTTFELFVADEGSAQYKTIVSRSDYVWFFGDGKYQAGYYFYNPPGLNALWLSQNLNDYVGGGSVAPPPSSHEILYTQVIASTQYIPPPAH